MQKYLFILGHNWRLALAEIDTYLKLKPYLGQITDYSANVAIVEFENDAITLNAIGNLMIRMGMVQKIGKMLDFIERRTLDNAFPEKIEENRDYVIDARRSLERSLDDVSLQVFKEPTGQKCFVANSIYPIEFSDPYYKILVQYFLQYLNKYWNTSLKARGAKQALYYQYPQEYIDNGNLNPIFPHHFFTYELYEPNRAEILYCQTEEGLYIGHTLTVVDANFQKQMDEDRPFKDFRQTIPPKFAKFLVSLLGLSPPYANYKILDPLCGTGTNLMFAYMLGYNVYGTDLREERVEGTRQNLKYMAEALGKKVQPDEFERRIKVADIKQIQDLFPESSFDGIVTEPVLLPFYREKPAFTEAETEVDTKVIPVYKEILQQAIRLLKPERRICLVSPLIHTAEKRVVKIPLQKIAQAMHYITINPLASSRISQKSSQNLVIRQENRKTLYDSGTETIAREFLIFQKSDKQYSEEQ